MKIYWKRYEMRSALGGLLISYAKYYSSINQLIKFKDFILSNTFTYH